MDKVLETVRQQFSENLTNMGKIVVGKVLKFDKTLMPLISIYGGSLEYDFGVSSKRDRVRYEVLIDVYIDTQKYLSTVRNNTDTVDWMIALQEMVQSFDDSTGLPVENCIVGAIRKDTTFGNLFSGIEPLRVERDEEFLLDGTLYARRRLSFIATLILPLCT